MNKTAAIFITLFFAGLIILILPDKGPRLIAFNNEHGPSFIDAAGLVLMLISCIAGMQMIIKRRRQIVAKYGNKNLYVVVFVYLLSLCGIVMALISAIEWLLWGCLIVASLSFLLLLFLAIRTYENR